MDNSGTPPTWSSSTEYATAFTAEREAEAMARDRKRRREPAARIELLIVGAFFASLAGILAWGLLA